MERLVRRLRHRSPFFLDEYRRRTRSFNSNTCLANDSLINDPDSVVLLEENASSRIAVLNRPSSLNAINTSMIKRLQKLYESWEYNPNVGFVVMKGSGKAFCAGGDIIFLHDMIKNGNIEGCKELFWRVAILDGITMGGGAGVSAPATFRVATNKTVYAIPETLIGHHPDGGASYHLSRLPGYLGEYLGLTGEKLNGVEMVECGLATHYTLSTNLQLVEERLKNLITNDPSVVKYYLEKHSDSHYSDNSSVLRRIETVNSCFSHDTVEEIIDALEREASKTNDGWCHSILKKLKYASPLSLKVALRSIREGRFQTLDQCLIREYRMSLQGISGQISSDFCEGVRALVVDKDYAPKWNPSSLEYVSQDMVDRYFSPLNAFEPDLDLPTKQRLRDILQENTNLKSQNIL